MRALVADDSAGMRRVLIGALGRVAITEVDQAGNGKEAVDAVMTNDYQLVLIDWNMPVVRGIDAIRAIRAAGKTMPIIVVTTEAERSRVLQALQAGANNYIIKPFESWTIVAKIQEVLAAAS
jgi:two-component system chemotaxis response regulator CheY